MGIAMVLSAVFYPNGVLRRVDRCNLPSVLHHHCSRDGAVCTGGIDSDPCPVCDHAQTGAKGDHGEGKGFFGWFNRMFDKSTHHYTDSVGGILRSTGRYLALYLIIVVGMAYLFVRLPSSFLPDEDQGYSCLWLSCQRVRRRACPEGTGRNDGLLP